MIATPILGLDKLERLAPAEVAQALGYPTTRGTVLDTIVAAARNNGIPAEEPATA